MRTSLWLLALCLWPSLHKATLVTNQSQLPLWSMTYCSYSQTASATSYNYFDSALDTNASYNPNTGWSFTAYEFCDPSTHIQQCTSAYHLESYRNLGATACQTCPYHVDTYWQHFSPFTTTGQFTPMFGPCFEGQPSMQTVCMQHPALFPNAFVGTYHFPMQWPFPPSVYSNSDFGASLATIPMHQFLSSTVSSWPYDTNHNALNPSLYGLGKASVANWLASIYFVNKTTNQKDTALTNAFLQPYQTENGIEQWILWTQFWCYPACHKSSMFMQVQVLPSDVLNNPELSYLSYYLQQGSSNLLNKCKPCPPYAASYEWNFDTNAPFDPRANPFATQCWPWFGALPVMLPPANTMNITFINHLDPSVDGVYLPQTEIHVASVPCPVNTYNRLCAHTKAYYFQMGNMQAYACTPCPSGGWHTGGLQGQWYCQPPPGTLFTWPNLQSVPDLWGNRDLLSEAQTFRELECGYLPAHCIQCAANDMPPGSLPADFNEAWVFSKLLQTRACLSGFYCPDAYTELLCPPQRPWSPPNSSALANCSCAAGTYLAASRCVPCTSACNVSGFYLPVSQCIARNGATADAPCIPCTNLPPSHALPTGVGQELLGVGGICPFQCTEGATLQTSALQTDCATPYTCVPLSSPPQNPKGQIVYYSAAPLPLDAFLLAGCSTAKPFSQALLATAASPWQPVYTSCQGLCNPQQPLLQLCYAAPQTAVLFAQQPWYSLSSQILCTNCPPPSLVPATAQPQGAGALAMSQACAPFIQCNNPAYYFNTTAWACQSCAARQAAVCPNNTRLKGMGCLGYTTPFNLSHPSVDCLPCALPVPNASTVGIFFLNYATSTGCAYTPCLPLVKGYYWSIPCQGFTQGAQALCSSVSSCPSSQFLAAPCTAYADRICQNCTALKPGSYRVLPCTLQADSQWSPCTQGFYCNGTGLQTPCPPGKTSQPWATQSSDCYCAVGTQPDEYTGQCMPINCSGTLQVCARSCPCAPKP